MSAEVVPIRNKCHVMSNECGMTWGSDMHTLIYPVRQVSNNWSGYKILSM